MDRESGRVFKLAFSSKFSSISMQINLSFFRSLTIKPVSRNFTFTVNHLHDNFFKKMCLFCVLNAAINNFLSFFIMILKKCAYLYHKIRREVAFSSIFAGNSN